MYYTLQKVVAFFLLVLLIPLFITLYATVRLTSSGPFLFRQQRAGKGKKSFTIFKIRTMTPQAEKQKNTYNHLNEANGPVFKIRNDPRFTKIGRWLAHSGLDELPQLVNIIRGEMAFVGPRPLPLDEAKEIPKKYETRFSILPGITSPWVVNGSHALPFDEWMRLDVEYVQKKSALKDVQTAVKTIIMIVRSIIRSITHIS